jgi:hypothetical protein
MLRLLGFANPLRWAALIGGLFTALAIYLQHRRALRQRYKSGADDANAQHAHRAVEKVTAAARAAADARGKSAAERLRDGSF